MATALDLAHRILRHPMPAISAILAAVARGRDLPIAEGLQIERDQFALAATRAETAQALDRWITRRDPA